MFFSKAKRNLILKQFIELKNPLRWEGFKFINLNKRPLQPYVILQQTQPLYVMY